MKALGPLRILIVEDEALLAMELEALIEESGNVVAGWATHLSEAQRLVDTVDADIAFVDLNLVDGPTGLDVARYIAERKSSIVVFITANPKQLPDDFAGAAGVIAKPYTINGLTTALKYLQEGVRMPPPATLRPVGFTLSPAYHARW